MSHRCLAIWSFSVLLVLHDGDSYLLEVFCSYTDIWSVYHEFSSFPLIVRFGSSATCIIGKHSTTLATRSSLRKIFLFFFLSFVYLFACLCFERCSPCVVQVVLEPKILQSLLTRKICSSLFMR
jgi:hypothetical protein